jgi:hypothetical protein
MKTKLRVLIYLAVVLIAAYLVIFIFAKGEDQEVKNLITTYNNVLFKAHLEMNSGLMRRMTSEKQRMKIDSYISYNLKNKRTIKGDILKLDFVEIKINDRSATVTTRETWAWYYIDPNTKEQLSDISKDTYGNIYELTRSQGHWVINELVSKVLEESGG